MNRCEEKLRDRWLHLGEELRRREGFTDLPGQGYWESVFFMLSRLYGEEHRYYHNLEHVSRCLRLFDSLSVDPGEDNPCGSGPGSTDRKSYIHSPYSLELAIWFHDAVYSIGSSENEKKSAQLAEKSLKEAGLSEEIVSEVEKLVLCTDYGDNSTSHLSVKPPDCSLIKDIDISILGSDWSTYLDYTKKIRREYRMYPESEYRERRRGLLRSFLEEKRIFETDCFFRNRESRARENLRREISELLGKKSRKEL